MGTGTVKRDWVPLAVHFRQRHEQGYLYLDNCGAFVLECEKELGLLPSEMNLTGAKLELPESGMNITVDPTDIKAVQQQPGDDGEKFAGLCTTLSELVQKYFSPTFVISRGFAWRSFRPYETPEDAWKASLEYSNESQEKLAKAIGMVPREHHKHETYISGSMELTVKIEPIVFKRLTTQKGVPPLRATDRQKRVIKRRNRRFQRIKEPPPYGLSLNVDLVENSPPVASVLRHFSRFLKIRDTVTEEVGQ